MLSSWGCPEPLTRAGSGASHSRISATGGEGPCATTAPGGPSLPEHGTKAEEIWWGWLLSTRAAPHPEGTVLVTTAGLKLLSVVVGQYGPAWHW